VAKKEKAVDLWTKVMQGDKPKPGPTIFKKPKETTKYSAKYSEAQVNEALWLYDKNKFTLVEIARTLNIPKSTLSGWVNKYKARKVYEQKTEEDQPEV